ncbi:MAG: DUF2752 domain-containing protein [Dermatophilaceae bacterium]
MSTSGSGLRQRLGADAGPSRPGSAVRELARRPVTWWGGVAASVGAAAYVYAVSPEIPGRYLACPTYTLTGTYCPGCGGLRSVHALLHGDLALSLQRNPAVLPLLVLLAVAAAGWLRRGRPPVRLHPSGWRFRLTLVAVAAFWVARNVPGWTWLSPA